MRRPIFASLGGIDECADIEIDLGKETYYIHFADVLFTARRALVLKNDCEYSLYRTSAAPYEPKTRSAARKPVESLFRFGSERMIHMDKGKTVALPIFKKDKCQKHFFVVNPSFAYSKYIFDDHKISHIQGERIVGNLVVCRVKILKKRLKGQLYTSLD